MDRETKEAEYDDRRVESWKKKELAGGKIQDGDTPTQSRIPRAFASGMMAFIAGDRGVIVKGRYDGGQVGGSNQTLQDIEQTGDTVNDEGQFPEGDEWARHRNSLFSEPYVAMFRTSRPSPARSIYTTIGSQLSSRSSRRTPPHFRDLRIGSTGRGRNQLKKRGANSSFLSSSKYLRPEPGRNVEWRSVRIVGKEIGQRILSGWMDGTHASILIIVVDDTTISCDHRSSREIEPESRICNTNKQEVVGRKSRDIMHSFAAPQATGPTSFGFL
ncbi:hypothetical protein DFH09DRAFT_1099525 [Mycena vulgaris]|nr:hypothetical protein DFH09DRAFT_1099525 [Mycena vulgaris]